MLSAPEKKKVVVVKKRSWSWQENGRQARRARTCEACCPPSRPHLLPRSARALTVHVRPRRRRTRRPPRRRHTASPAAAAPSTAAPDALGRGAATG